MAKVSGREEQEKFLLEIQDKELSPVIALLSSMRIEISETRTKCLERESGHKNEVFKLCLSKEHPKLAVAVKKLKELQERIEKEIA
jgi:hypothetical protein